MKKILLASMALAIIPLFSASAADATCCSPSGPDGDKWHVTTVGWIKSHESDWDKDFKSVALIGKVTKKHNGDTYFFTDGTGTIELDSDIELPVGEAIVVRGRIDEAFMHIGPLELDVRSWRHVKKAGEYLK